MRIVLAAAASCLMITGAVSQDGPRSYHLLPEGTDVLSLSTRILHLTREYAPGELPGVDGSVTDVTVFTPTYRQSLDIFGNAGAFMIGLPLGNISTTLDTPGGDFELEAADFAHGDLFISGVFGLLGSPSLTPMEYVQYKPGFRAGVVTKLFLPTGDYDSTRDLNLGGNRWSLHTSLPISYVLGDSMVDPELMTFELMPVMHIFGDNDDPNGYDVMSQDPVFGLEGHLTRNFGSKVWASLDAFYEFGGETSRDGVAQDDAEETLSLGATLGLSLTQSLALRVSYDEVVYSSVPDSTSRTLHITSAYLF